MPNICSTKVERFFEQMLGKCWMNRVFKLFQRHSTFSRTKESMLNESLNQFRFDSTHFQQAFNTFYAFNNVERPVQTPPTFGSTTVLNGMMKKKLKPFKRAITVTVPAHTVDKPAATDVKKERHPSAWEQVFDPCQ